MTMTSFVSEVDLGQWVKKLAVQCSEIYAIAEEKSGLGKCVKHSLAIMEEALRRYGPDKISISFNGGKDCTVMLHLWAAVRYKAQGGLMPKLHALYILDPNAFDEMDHFVNDTVPRYQLDLVAVEGSMKVALAEMLATYPDIKAVLIGARRTDLSYYNEMNEFVPCDKGWPKVMRVHPVLDWHYCHIWEFLQRFEVPFCSLYNQGYTSIGNVFDTVPNPALKKPHGGYGPAWELQDETLERAGRTKH